MTNTTPKTGRGEGRRNPRRQGTAGFFSFFYFNRTSTTLIDVCEKRLGYRHTLTMQWGGQVMSFKSFTVGARHLAPHLTVNQFILDGPHLIEFAPVAQKFPFKSGLVRFRQLAEQIYPDQIFALINFHDAGLTLPGCFSD
jgi:hypothetical protein